MTYIMSCVWLDYMVKYFQCKNCVGSSPKTKKCVASFLVPGDIVVASFISLAAIFYPPIASALMTLRLATDFLQKKSVRTFIIMKPAFSFVCRTFYEETQKKPGSRYNEQHPIC